MKLKLAFLFILVINYFAFTADMTADNNGPAFNKVEVKGIVFQWRVNNGMLDVIVSAPTKGWIGVGFDPSFIMKGADYIIGYIKDNTIYMQDNYGTGLVKHKPVVELGGTDVITNKNGKQKDNITMLSFSIPLAAKDKYHKNLKKGKHKIVLAYSKDADFTSEHQVAASININIE